MTNSFLGDMLGAREHQAFLNNYYRKQPYAKPGVAANLIHSFDWQMTEEIISVHNNCWIANRGRLESTAAHGKVTSTELLDAFTRGHSLVIRHGEKAHPFLRQLGAEFHNEFKAGIDIQLYMTPATEFGFDWHYDLEDVFIFQTVGSKEFTLKKNRFTQQVPHRELPRSFYLSDYTEGPEISCLLMPGDYLYIPAGYWHKARAVETSFHISVGVLNS